MSLICRAFRSFLVAMHERIFRLISFAEADRRSGLVGHYQDSIAHNEKRASSSLQI